MINWESNQSHSVKKRKPKPNLEQNPKLPWSSEPASNSWAVGLLDVWILHRLCVRDPIKVWSGRQFPVPESFFTLDFQHLSYAWCLGLRQNFWNWDTSLTPYIGYSYSWIYRTIPIVHTLAVHQVNFFGWIVQGDHSWYLNTLILKVRVDW